MRAERTAARAESTRGGGRAVERASRWAMLHGMSQVRRRLAAATRGRKVLWVIWHPAFSLLGKASGIWEVGADCRDAGGGGQEETSMVGVVNVATLMRRSRSRA